MLGEHAQNRYLFCPYSVLSKFKGRLLDNRNWLFLNFKSLFVAIWLCCYTPGCSLNSTKKLINFWQKLFIPNLIFDLYFLRRNLLIWWRNQSVATNFLKNKTFYYHKKGNNLSLFIWNCKILTTQPEYRDYVSQLHRFKLNYKSKVKLWLQVCFKCYNRSNGSREKYFVIQYNLIRSTDYRITTSF